MQKAKSNPHKGGDISRTMLSMAQQYTILTLHKQGKTNAAIAKDLSCHRHTVENILRKGDVTEKQTRKKPSAATPYKEQLVQWYEKDITVQRMHEMLMKEHQIAFTYDALQKFVKKYIAKPPEAFGVQEHLPGNDLEVDFGDIVVYLEEEKKKVKLQALAFVLPYSGMKYYAVCEDQKLETFCEGFRAAFAYFGGVPRKVKPDNLKAAVIKNQRYELVFNQSFLEFANHYAFTINPCDPYSPEQKGTVEGSVKYAQKNFVPGRVFTNKADVKKQLREWNEGINKKVHGTTKKVIEEAFLQEEKGKLLPLPREEFSFFYRCERIVGRNCHIHLENNYYSVPFSLTGKQVTVRWNASVVRIIAEGVAVALHQKSTGQGNYVTKRVHLPADKIYSESEYQQKHANRMQQIGSNASLYFTMLLEKQPRYWYQTLRSVYGLVAVYEAEAVNKALGRALSYGVYDTRIIRNILEGKLYELTDTVTPAICFEQTSNSRDLWYYEQAVRESTGSIPIGLHPPIQAAVQTNTAGTNTAGIPEIPRQEGFL